MGLNRRSNKGELLLRFDAEITGVLIRDFRHVDELIVALGYAIARDAPVVTPDGDKTIVEIDKKTIINKISELTA